MDREAFRTAVVQWLESVAQNDPQLDWLSSAELDVQPAFLVDHQTRDGDDYKAGAVGVVLTGEGSPTTGQSRQLHDQVVGDRTLGGFAKDTRFEYRSEERVVVRLVVVPR